MSSNHMSKKHLQNVAEKLCKCTHFKKAEVEALCQVFKAFSQGARMDRLRFRDILHNSFCMTEDLIMDRVFKAFDLDNDGYISLEEWVKGLSVFLRGDFGEKKKFCFEVFDTNGDGFISRDEMFMLLKTSLVRKEVVSAFYGEELQQTTEEDPDEGIKDLVDICLKKIDFDHDGRLSFEDYSQAVDEDSLLLEVLGQCLPDTKRWIAFEEMYISRSRYDHGYY